MKVIGGAPVKRRLEFDGSDDDPSGKMAAMQVMSGQTKGIFVMRRCLVILFFSTGTASSLRIPGAQRAALDADQSWSATDSNRPPSSTALFFRKVYYLASVRLLDLCDRLRMDERGKQRVWTLFEHVLRTETSLMTGRHLDQNLMCCIYVVAKVFSAAYIFIIIIIYFLDHKTRCSISRYHVSLSTSATSDESCLSSCSYGSGNLTSNNRLIIGRRCIARFTSNEWWCSRR